MTLEDSLELETRALSLLLGGKSRARSAAVWWAVIEMLKATLAHKVSPLVQFSKDCDSGETFALYCTCSMYSKWADEGPFC